MGKKSRDKGKNGENEARKVLCEAFGIPYVRKVTAKLLKRGSQSQGTDVEEDITNTPWSIEVKRYAKDLTPGELNHAWRQAKSGGKEPIVMTRKDHGTWKVWFRLKLDYTDQEFRAMMPLQEWADYQKLQWNVTDWIIKMSNEIEEMRNEQ